MNIGAKLEEHVGLIAQRNLEQFRLRKLVNIEVRLEDDIGPISQQALHSWPAQRRPRKLVKPNSKM